MRQNITNEQKILLQQIVMIGKFFKKSQVFLGKNNKYYFMNNNQFNSDKDYYQILGVKKNSSINQIKQSYFRLAKQYHPDVSKGYEAKFKQISEAYGVLSDQDLKKQYDSARIFGSFTNRMGSKASSGDYQYQNYKYQYKNMSEQQKQQLIQQFKRKSRNLAFFGIGFVIFWLYFTRNPHRYYNQSNGQLIPFQPAMQMNPMGQGNYPQSYDPYAGGNMTQNSYQNQAYQPPGYAPMQGNQNYYGGQQGNPNSNRYGSGMPNNMYNPANFRSNPNPQQNTQSEYAVLKAQTIQPYPNSPYAPKTMQSNYQPNYKPDAPQNLK